MNERERRDFEAGLAEEVDAWLSGKPTRRTFITRLGQMMGMLPLAGLALPAWTSEAVAAAALDLADASTPLGKAQAAALKASTEGPADGSADDVATVYRFLGPFFFGASATVAAALERTGGFPPYVILDFSAVPLTDLSGIAALKTFTGSARREGATILVAGATPTVRNVLLAGGLGLDESQFAPDVTSARAAAKARHRASGSA